MLFAQLPGASLRLLLISTSMAQSGEKHLRWTPEKKIMTLFFSYEIFREDESDKHPAFLLLICLSACVTIGASDILLSNISPRLLICLQTPGEKHLRLEKEGS